MLTITCNTPLDTIGGIASTFEYTTTLVISTLRIVSSAGLIAILLAVAVEVVTDVFGSLGLTAGTRAKLVEVALGVLMPNKMEPLIA